MIACRCGALPDLRCVLSGLRWMGMTRHARWAASRDDFRREPDLPPRLHFVLRDEVVETATHAAAPAAGLMASSTITKKKSLTSSPARPFRCSYVTSMCSVAQSPPDRDADPRRPEKSPAAKPQLTAVRPASVSATWNLPHVRS